MANPFAFDYDNSPNLTPEEIELAKKPLVTSDSEIKKGAAGFIDQTQALGGGIVGLAGEKLGLPGVRDWGLDVYNKNMEEATQGWQRPAVPTVEDIKFSEPGGVGRAVDWAENAGTQGVLNLATMAVGGGVGGAIGKTVAKSAVKEAAGIAAAAAAKRAAGGALAPAVEGVAEAAAKKVADAGLKGQFYGGFAGAAAGNTGMEAGGAFGQMVQDGVSPEKAATPALAYGLASNIVEFGPEFAIAKATGLDKGLKQWIRNWITSDSNIKNRFVRALAGAGTIGAGGAAVEGGTESVQQLMQIGAERWAKQEPLFAALSDEDKSAILNAGAAGALTGGLVGGAGGSVKGFAAKATKAAADVGVAPPQQEVPNEEAGTAAPAAAQAQTTPQTATAGGVGGQETGATPEQPGGVAQPGTEAAAVQQPSILEEAESIGRGLDEIGKGLDSVEQQIGKPQQFPGSIVEEGEDIERNLDSIEQGLNQVQEQLSRTKQQPSIAEEGEALLRSFDEMDAEAERLQQEIDRLKGGSNAQQEQIPTSADGSRSAQPTIREEGGRVAEGGEGVQPSGQGEQAATAGSVPGAETLASVPQQPQHTTSSIRQSVEKDLGADWLRAAEQRGLVEIRDEVGPQGIQAEFNRNTNKITIYARSVQGNPSSVVLHEGSHQSLDVMLHGRLGEFAKEIVEQAKRDPKGQAAAAVARAQASVEFWKQQTNNGANSQMTAKQVWEEEIFAYFVEHAKEGGLFRRAINAIKAGWIDSAIGRAFAKAGLSPKMTDGVAAALARRAVKFSIGLHDEVQRLSANTEQQQNPDQLASFAGPRAATANYNSLEAAQEFIDEGVDPEQVRQTTGWFRGDDGKWRFEIDDSAAKLIGNDGSLGEVLDHPRLFAAYPQLQYVQAEVKTEPGNRVKASFNHNTFEIKVAAPDEENALSALLHEVQHVVQKEEGFARGGGASLFKPGGALEHLRQADETPNQAYMRLAGEVEARNVQARQRMTEEKRRAIGPDVTRDVAKERVVFKERGESLVSIPEIQPSQDKESAIVSWAKQKFGSMKAPDGSLAWKNFIEWFGDSKVINPSGTPKILYHGTLEDRLSFSDMKRGGIQEFTVSHFGELYVAEEFADREGGHLYPVYLSIKNPLRIQDSGRSHDIHNLKTDVAAVLGINKNSDSFRSESWEGLLTNAGYDGIIYLNRKEGYGRSGMVWADAQLHKEWSDAQWKAAHPEASDSYIPVSPTQIKSAVGNKGSFGKDPNILASVPDPLWRSGTLDAIRSIKQNKASGEQWLNMLTQRDGKTGQRVPKLPGVSVEEMEDMGLVDWLESREGAVGKDEVEGFVRDGGVKVEEVQYEDDDAYRERVEKQVQKAKDTEIARRISLGISREEAEYQLLDEDFWAEEWAKYDNKSPKFTQYQLPGGANYRELLITIPSTQRKLTDAEVREYNLLKRKELDGKLTSTETARFKELASIGNAPNTEYKSSHWSEPNVLVHLRFNERTDAEGEKVLLVEEVQSDWHQEGRKKGYGNGPNTIEGAVKKTVIGGKVGQLYWHATNKDNVLLRRNNGDLHVILDNGQSEQEAVQSLNKLLEDYDWTLEAISGHGVPNAPLKSTSTWAMLGMKRAIRWAAEHGFDKVAWTPGEAQAERYDLSKQVKEIEYIKHEPDSYELAITDLNGEGIDLPKERYTTSELEDVVGKEITQKIVNGEGRSYRGHAGKVLEGLDLKVGGQGMRSFYDKMLPSEMKKYVKKFGGTVGTTEIDVEGRTQQVWSTTLTPALKDEALAGQRLYSISQQIRDLYDQGYNEVVGDWSKGDVGMAARFQRWIQDVHNILAKLEKKKGVSAEDSVYEAENKVRSQQAEANRVLDEKWVFPMLKLIGKNKWSVKQVDKAIYARAAREVNAHLREVSAKIWLRRLAASMDDAGQRKLLEKAIEKVKAETSSKVNVGGKEVTKVEVKARRQQMYALLKEWASKDPDTTSISQPIIDKFWEYDSKPSGMTNDEADTEMKNWVGNADMQQLFLILDDMNAQSLNALVASGMISQEMALKWRGTNPHYVTLRRAGFEEQQGGKGQGHSAGRASSLRAGSTKPAVDVFSNTIMTARRYITLNHNNELMQKFYDMVKNPAYDFKNEFEISVGDQVKYLDKDGFLDEGLTKAEDNELEMRVWFNGKKYLIRAKEDNKQMRAIVGAMNNLDSPAFGPVTKFFAKANHFMARMNTSLSPEFFFTNPIRDLLEAQMNMSDSEADKVRGAVLKSLPEMWKGLWQIYRGRSKGEDMTSHPLYKVLQQYEEAGVPSSWLAFHETAADHTKALERQIKQLSPEMSLTKASHIAATFIEDTNRMAENALRLATFKALLDAGVKVGRAATIVKELTVNFDRRGSAGPAINAFYMFANASIQGSARVFKAIATSKKVQKLAAGVVIAAILSEWANGSNDDWDKIDEKKKQRNLIFRNPTGVGPEFVSIPAPWGYNVLWTLGRKIGEGMRGKRGWTAGGASVDLLENVLDSFNPIQGGTLAQTLAPTLGRPIVQIAENKDWTGERPLRPTPFPGQPTPESQQMWESTSIISKTMAGLLNAATGGDKVTSGWIDVSPTSLDAWASQIFGATGNTVRSILNLPSELTDPMKEFEVGRLPVLRKFSAAPNASIEGAVYHERVAQIHDIAYRLKKYEEGVDKDLTKARELRVGSRQLLALEPAMKEAEKQLTDLRKRMAVAQASGSDERVRAMRQRMKEVRERFNQTFERRVGE